MIDYMENFTHQHECINMRWKKNEFALINACDYNGHEHQGAMRGNQYMEGSTLALKYSVKVALRTN